MQPAAQAGDVIDDRYRIARMIGRGAMADVFAAEDQIEGGTVALKILRATVARDPALVERFRREAEVQEIIAHRNVARLLHAGLASGKPYLAMEFLRGRSLLHVLRKLEHIPVHYAASYVWQALQGLSATHAAGVLHRDLKPANLMLEPSPGPVERVVLIDFGFAALGASTGLTTQGTVVGSVSYLAPERLRGDPTDGRADLYGMGIILYELLVGAPPFTGDDAEILRGHLEGAAVPPSRAGAQQDIPEALDALVMRTLAKRPEDRYPDALAMADALEEAVQPGI